MSDPLELLWDNLLSRHPEQVQKAYAALSLAEQQAVASHLQSMVSEPGWQPEQRISARAALEAIVAANEASRAG